MRAEIDGNVVWAPRVTQQREQVCGQEPSVGAPAPTEADADGGVAELAPVVQARSLPAPRTRRKARTGYGQPAREPSPVLVIRRWGKPVPSTELPGSTRVVPLHVARQRARAGTFRVPAGYRAAWEDDRLNPRRTEGTLAGRDAMNLVWTATVPRRLIDRASGRDVTAKVALVYPFVDYEVQRRELGEVTLATRGGKVVKMIGRSGQDASDRAVGR